MQQIGELVPGHTGGFVVFLFPSAWFGDEVFEGFVRPLLVGMLGGFGIDQDGRFVGTFEGALVAGGIELVEFGGINGPGIVLPCGAAN